ncbi:TIGR02679 domain-containing protein [Paenibacillus sp. J2TS4]|uniref:TIGR02679 domain-containing protein n=1 Tax=Paenibacillus sp. J2TS4 TaxID=2807194 RepID=UPI001B1C512B|nr:TIGR02679 domain-containing protein [Paenibacillus sp. J2TS4]GIP33367.1 hypothetical protein J2TS4_25770 [Paenibacillus sp. J2TS4]
MRRNLQASERAKAYFGRPGFSRMLSLMWKKYESLERIGGKAVVKCATEEECEAINLFFGWNYKEGDTIRIGLQRFEEELSDSPFPYRLTELHQLLEATPLLTKSEKRMMRQREWQHLFLHLRNVHGDELPAYVDGWLRRLEGGDGQGYRTLKEVFLADPMGAEAELGRAVRALIILFSERPSLAVGPIALSTIRLPVLAAKASGDSHALDWKQPAGRLLFYALRERLSEAELEAGQPEGRERGKGFEENVSSSGSSRIGHSNMLADHEEESKALTEGSEVQAEDNEDIVADSLAIREVYRSVGIADDDLSSLVYVYIPRLGLSPEPTVWTLRQVEKIKGTDVPQCSALYVVENPSIFSTLLDITAEWMRSAEAVRLEGNRTSMLNSVSSLPVPVLICTSGPTSAAALRWIQLCLDHSGNRCPIYYSGDFDVKGLVMGSSLAHRFPEHYVPWRFDLSTYREMAEGHPGPSFGHTDLSKLAKLIIPWDEELQLEMSSYKVKLFQEAFISLLAEDWLQAVSRSQ